MLIDIQIIANTDHTLHAAYVFLIAFRHKLFLHTVPNTLLTGSKEKAALLGSELSTEFPIEPYAFIISLLKFTKQACSKGDSSILSQFTALSWLARSFCALQCSTSDRNKITKLHIVNVNDVLD